MFCAHCGFKMKEVDRFCTECGQKPETATEIKPLFKAETNHSLPPPLGGGDPTIPSGLPEAPEPTQPTGADGRPVPEPAPSSKEPTSLSKEPHDKKTLSIIASVCVLLAIVIAVGLFLILRTSSVEVPDLSDLTEAEAIQEIEELGLVVGDITREYHESVDEGLVIAQSPRAGREVESGSAIHLTISLGIEDVLVPVEVPDFIHLTLDEATDLIEEAGLSLGNVDEAFSETVEEGLVISQSVAAGTMILQGETINLVISLGSGLVSVPDFTGLDKDEARELIVSINLDLGRITSEYDADVEEGQVISQSIEAGEAVEPNTSIDLVVSLGRYASVNPFNFDVWGEDHIVTLERDGITVDVPMPPWLNLEEYLFICDGQCEGCSLYIYERYSVHHYTLINVATSRMPDDGRHFLSIAESEVNFLASTMNLMDRYSSAVAVVLARREGDLTATISYYEHPEDGSGDLIPSLELVRVNDYNGLLMITRLRISSRDAPDICTDEFLQAFGFWWYWELGILAPAED